MVNDDGAFEPVLALLVAALMTTVLAIVGSFGVYTAHERIQGAADLAALAVASHGDCDIAATVAERNGAQLIQCSTRAGDVRVEVHGPRLVRGPLRLLPDTVFHARAHAAAADAAQAG